MSIYDQFFTSCYEPLALFTIAMALHLFINDHNLFKAHDSAYYQLGRVIMVASLILGYLIGLSVSLSQPVIAMVIAFISGGMIMNVFHNELPTGYQLHRLKPFVAAAIGYALILLFLG